MKSTLAIALPISLKLAYSAIIIKLVITVIIYT